MSGERFRKGLQRRVEKTDFIFFFSQESEDLEKERRHQMDKK